MTADRDARTFALLASQGPTTDPLRAFRVGRRRGGGGGDPPLADSATTTSAASPDAPAAETEGAPAEEATESTAQGDTAGGGGAGGSACEAITDEEARAAMGGEVTKQEAGGGSCNLDGGTAFATAKFETGTDLDLAASVIEDTFDTKVEPLEGVGDRALSFETSGLIGVLAVQGSTTANVAGGGLDLDAVKQLAQAMLN